MSRSKPRAMAGEGVECVLDRVHVQRPGGEGKPGTFGGLKSLHCGWNIKIQGGR